MGQQSGKTGYSQQPYSGDQSSGKGGTTSSLVSDQPSMGQPNTNMTPQSNQYPNTVGSWDNATIQQPQQDQSSGKGGKNGGTQYSQPTYTQPLDVYTPSVVTPVSNPAVVQPSMPQVTTDVAQPINQLPQYNYGGYDRERGGA